MKRPRFSILLIALFGGLVAITTTHAGKTSDTKVKATATTTKISPDGKQIVTLTLDIEKGWYIYANPINTNSDTLKPNQTRVSLKAKEKIETSVKYPAGKQKKDKETKTEFDIYEDRIVIRVEVTRTMGDASPLQVSISVNACNKGECLMTGTVKLTVP